ncbi:unnamed protein product [Calicophoron daubneyi]|uniref:RING-type domain-containing protein n=1 Tax=Calicophoron daubneyi TaxID=300641 RepID=A0AAV2TAG0_CALDB
MTESIEVAEVAEEFTEESESTFVEPRLKYRRIEHDMDALTSNDSVMCLAAHEKFIAVGTELGRVHVMDHGGYPAENGVYSVHSSPVNQLSIAENGEFLASCGDDGKIAVYNLSDPEQNSVFRMDHEVKSVALAPDYSKSQVIVFGYDKLYLLSPGLFKRQKHGELTRAHGLIRLIKWRDEFILWADDSCVGVYGVRDRQPIAYMQYSTKETSLYNRTPVCCLNWCTDTCFLIGRGHSLRICQILDRYTSSDQPLHSRYFGSHMSSLSSIPSGDSPSGVASRYVEICYHTELPDSLIYGVTRHQDSILVLVRSVLDTASAATLGLVLVDPESSLMGSTPVPAKTHHERWELKTEQARSGKKALGIESVSCENTHYIVSPKKVWCAEEMKLDDRIDWLLERRHFQEALTAARNDPQSLVNHSVQSVGITCIDYLIGAQRYSEAATICSEVLEDKSSWETYTYEFLRLGQILVLTPVLPDGTMRRLLKLDHSVYEAVLVELMDHHPVEFHALLSQWCQAQVFDSYDNILNILIDRIERHASISGVNKLSLLDSDLRSLWQALALLYEKVGSQEQAVDILVRLSDPGVFDLFERSLRESNNTNLLEVLKDRVIWFMELDSSKTIVLLLDHSDLIPSDYVVSQLETRPELLYHYLDSFYNRFPQLSAPYLAKLIQLYIVYGREKLLPLLRSTDQYPLSEALRLCQEAKLVVETVYLLTRVGRRGDALQLLMTQGRKPGDPDLTDEEQQAAAAAAIAYCREEDIRTATANECASLMRKSNAVYGVTIRYDAKPDECDEYENNGNAGELWQQVVLYAVDKPAFICALLQHADSGDLDPRLLFRKISPELKIPGLRDSLVKLMHNYKLQLELYRGCERILQTDVRRLFQKLLRIHSSGVRADSGRSQSVNCSMCSKPLVVVRSQSHPLFDQNEADKNHQSCFVFSCTHAYHQSCLGVNERERCPICFKA